MEIRFNDKAIQFAGQAKFVLSGEIQHYRLPPCQWRDRLEKLAAMGLSSVGVYAGWNYHSPAPGVYDFTSPERDFGRFLDTAKAAGLFALVRPGPYVCNEWDLGRHPGWLLEQSRDDWRTAAEPYLSRCLEWYDAFDRVVVPRQATRGGNVIMYQVENEHWWGCRELFDALAAKARADGIDVPLMSNGGGSVGRCGSTSFPDGCDIYTSVGESYRWRGWLELALRQSGEAPLMVVEYNGGSFNQWGLKALGEKELPAAWTLALTRLFIGMGANFVNPFIVAGGVTPINFGSDHCCTSYFDDAAVSRWGGLSPKFYLFRTLALAVSSVENALAEAKPAPGVWATDSGYVEGLLREGAKGKFVLAYNGSSHSEEFHLVLPGGRTLPETGTFSIPPAGSQLHMIDIDCAPGVRLVYSVAEVLKIWRDGETLGIAVHGPEGLAGHLVLERDGRRERVDDVCTAGVCARSAGPVKIYALSTPVAERSWFVTLGARTLALFGGLDLVRPQSAAGPVEAQVRNDAHVALVATETIAVDGADVSAKSRADGLVEYALAARNCGSAGFTIGQAAYADEEFSWTHEFPDPSPEWRTVEIGVPGRDVIVNPGVYHYVTRFTCGDDIPAYLEFLGISACELVVFVNGRKLGVFPDQRKATFHELADYRLRIPLTGAAKKGQNVLAVTVTVIGRHNCGNPLFAGLSHPLVFYRERVEEALPVWEFAEYGNRKFMAAELDAASPDLFRELDARGWTEKDLSTGFEVKATGLSDWLDIRAIRRQITIPARMQGRPLFLEAGKLDDAWCYVDGRLIGRAYHQMSATFDLSAFANRPTIDVVIVGRHYWQDLTFPKTVPKLLSPDSVLSGSVRRRDGSAGERQGYITSPAVFSRNTPPAHAQALWVKRAVTCSIPDGLIAPVFVELDEGWRSNAVLYWNGHAIGRYSVVGPDRQFYIPSGLICPDNDLVAYVDGHGSDARAGGVTLGVFDESVTLKIRTCTP